MPFRTLTKLLLAGSLVCARAWAQSPPTAATLQGAWKLTSLSVNGKGIPATGYMLFSGSYYSFITNTERPKLSREASSKAAPQMSDEEKQMYVETLRSMTASAGTFTIDGDQIQYHQEVTRLPYLVGETEKRKSWIDGGRLIQDFAGGGGRRVMKWEKLSVSSGKYAQ